MLAVGVLGVSQFANGEQWDCGRENLDRSVHAQTSCSKKLVSVDGGEERTILRVVIACSEAL